MLTSDETLALATVLDKLSDDQARSILGSFETYVDYVNARAKIAATASETIYAARAGRRAPEPVSNVHVTPVSSVHVTPRELFTVDPDRQCGHVDPDEGACILVLGHDEAESHWHSMFGRPRP